MEQAFKAQQDEEEAARRDSATRHEQERMQMYRRREMERITEERRKESEPVREVGLLLVANRSATLPAFSAVTKYMVALTIKGRPYYI